MARISVGTAGVPVLLAAAAAAILGPAGRGGASPPLNAAAPSASRLPARAPPSVSEGVVLRYTLPSVNARSRLGLVVTTAADEVDANDGVTSLREAIQLANSLPGTNAITFNIPGAGVHTIAPTSPLPTITHPVTIDGYSQPGAEPNTLGLWQGTNAQLLIEIDGANAGSGANGLDVAAGRCAIRGLVIDNFGGDAIRLGGGNGAVAGCFLGTNVTGDAALGNDRGVYVDGPNNTIGGTKPAAVNLLSGNRSAQASIEGSAATGNHVFGNYVGTNAAGGAALLTLAYGADPGVEIAAGHTLVGGAASGAGNLISGNGAGISVLAPATGTRIQGNRIGTDAAGARAVPNTGWGVAVFATTGNLVGGDATLGQGNLISGNGGDGVGLPGDANRAQGNTIGLNAAGNAAIPNGVGVFIHGGFKNNVVGGRTHGAGNVISGNANNGILVTDADTAGNLIQGNRIGMNAAGTAAIPNGASGVEIRNGAANNLIGGATAAARNVVSGNTASQVAIHDAASTGNQVQGNYIGTDVSGSAALRASPYGADPGVEISAPGTVVGGTTRGDGNVISGNGAGISIYAPAALTRVQGNRIGTDASGMRAVSNTGWGVAIFSATGNLIGGDRAAGGGNLISGNGGDGVGLPGDDNVVQGNIIGLNAAGNAPIPNFWGVNIHSGHNNLVGGTTPGAGNVISGNTNDGVLFHEASSNNQILGNSIGTNATGSAVLPNGANGVEIRDGASNNEIGQPVRGAGNRIAFNVGTGVVVIGDQSIGNSIRGNAIAANGALGIDLGGDGVTANDPGGGPRVGPNNLQNYPVISDVNVAAGTLTITGTLKSVPDSDFALDFYRSASADPSGFGPGQAYLGSSPVTTDATGSAAFRVVFRAPAGVTGQYLTATASRDYGGGVFETSEFGQAVQAP